MFRNRYLTYSMAAVIVLFTILVAAVYLGALHRRVTKAQVDSLIRRDLPVRASVGQVKTWLDAKRIKHTAYQTDHMHGSGGVITATIYSSNPVDIVATRVIAIFTFDARQQLIRHSVHEEFVGP